MFACLTNTGASTSSVRFNIIVNGTIVLNPGPLISLTAGESGCISAAIPFTASPGRQITFRATRISGTSPIICDAANSSIVIQLLNTLQ